MGEYYRIQLFYICSQHLVPKIRARINDHGSSLGLNQYAGTKALIFFIGGSANRAFASNHRNSAAGAGTEEGDFKFGITHDLKVRNEKWRFINEK